MPHITTPAPTIIYDAECPLCSNYARMSRLRLLLGDVRLIDARSADPLISELQCAGYDLNAGMVFIERDRMHYGAGAMRRIAALTRDPTLIDKILASPAVSRTIYPFLVLGRRLLLALLGRTRIPAPALRSPATRRRQLHTVIFLGMFAYFVAIQPQVVALVKHLPGYGVRQEIFPIFSWSLFSYPKRYVDKFSIVPLETTADSPVADRIGKITNGDHTRVLRESQHRKTALTLFHGLRNQDPDAATRAKQPYDNFARALGVTRYRFVKVEVDVLTGEDYRHIDYGILTTDGPVTLFEKPIYKIIEP
ncbi:MAG: DCC1-like thiol-disulfide oxidoreductase family protein [Roseobacter sp.]